jgi:hypothetical protein
VYKLPINYKMLANSKTPKLWIISLLLVVLFLAGTGCVRDKLRVSELTIGGGSPTICRTDFLDDRLLKQVNAAILDAVQVDATVDEAARERINEIYLSEIRQGISFETKTVADLLGDERSKVNELSHSELMLMLRDPNSKLGRMANQKGIEALLQGSVSQFQQRTGSAIGTDVPSKAGFSLVLRDIRTGNLIWSGSYFYADEALSSNLFNLPGRIAATGSPLWQDAFRMLRRGMNSCASALANTRQGLFMVPVTDPPPVGVDTQSS